MGWRLAGSIKTLRAEVNARWPDRDRTSDGTIGDADHASRSSDHNPWIKDPNTDEGVVRALDIDRDRIDAAWYAEAIRALGKGGDPRLQHGGCVIYNRLIASYSSGWEWRRYDGPNPHTSHVHVSVTRLHPAYDDVSPWGITRLPPKPAAHPVIHNYEEASVQTALVRVGPVGADGKGWNAWDTGKPAPVVVGCAVAGLRPRPKSEGGDGTYPGYQGVTPSVAPEKSWVLVSVEGARPGETVGVYVSVA